MPRRLTRILRRLLLVLLVLGVLGVGAFTWFCYWPLEGDVDDLMRLVPEDVEFVLRADWEDLESTGWVQKNVLDDPVHPALAEQAGKVLGEVRARVRDLEGQINAFIPVGFLQFGVEEDVLEGEVAVAGKFCRGLGPDRGPPTWQEILVLKRVSWKTRCIAALKHDFVRSRLGPRLEVSAEEGEVYRLTFPFEPVSPERARSGCGGGFVLPPENQWFLRRVQGVLAISNSETLIRRVADLATQGDSARGSFAARPGYQTGLQAGRLVAAVEMEPLHWYFARAFEHYPALKPLRRFLQPNALQKLNGWVSLAGRDLVDAGADISYVSAQAPEVSRAVYSLAERSVREGIATLVPAKDTFAIVTLRCDPEYLLKSLVADVLSPGDRKLWDDNLKRMKEFESIDEFLADLATRVGNEAMIALARLGDTFDQVDYTQWYSSEIDPMPAAAVMVRIKEGADQQELDAYLASKVPLLGFSEELAKVEYRGYTYSRAELQQKVLDFALVTPCFILANDYLIVTTNEAFMRQVLDTVKDRSVASLGQDETFLQTMAALPERGHVGFFVDLEKLTRVPREAEGGGPPGTRGLLWDHRNQWVIQNRDDRREAIRFRGEVGKRYPPRPSVQEQIAIDDEVDRHIEQWRANFPQFVEEYRRELEGLRRFRGLGLVLGATADTISARVAVVFREAEPWLVWRR